MLRKKFNMRRLQKRRKKYYNLRFRKYNSCEHPFHLVTPSPWPFLTSVSVFCLVIGFVMYIHSYSNGGFIAIFGFIYFLLCIFYWFRDVIREGTFEGHHTIAVQRGLKLGMLLFIISEVFFFLAFFWAFFHSSLSPAVEIGGIWPPKGIVPFDPYKIPLVNTLILITSGISVTWAHRALILKNRYESIYGLIVTIGLGVFFTFLQIFEYKNASFSISDGIYGSLFFMLTGFHGFHVLVGTIFLFVGLLRHIEYHFTSKHHVGLECAIWYWHFVDVVWIFLYIFVYIWGGK